MTVVELGWFILGLIQFIFGFIMSVILHRIAKNGDVIPQKGLAYASTVTFLFLGTLFMAGALL